MNDAAARTAPTAPAPRSRPRTVPRSRVVAIMLAVALVAVAMAGDRLSGLSTPYELVDAPLDLAVRYADGEVVLSDVRVATTLLQSSDTYTTAGMFVVVHVAVRATGTDKVTVASSRMLAQGVTYEPAFIAGQTITADPGFVVERDLVFEVDPARTADLTLELWNSGLVFRYYQRTRTSVGITRENASQWAGAARDVSLTIPRNAITTALP